MDSEFTQLLAPVARTLCSYLQRTLPVVQGDNWWTVRVVPVLTVQQQDNVKRRRITSLAGLDVAALLRIVDQNWRDLAAYAQWPPEVRHYVKEAQTIRNRWAHPGLQPPSRDDIYRDVDTLCRLVRALEASSDLLEIFEAAKKTLLARPNDREPEPSSVPRGPVFFLQLGRAYYERGFFNVSVDFQRYVRSDNGPISIRVGNAATIQGRVSRDANPGTGAPRIFGGAALRDWFQKHFQLDDRVEVHFDSPDSLRLSEPN